MTLILAWIQNKMMYTYRKACRNEDYHDQEARKWI